MTAPGSATPTEPTPWTVSVPSLPTATWTCASSRSAPPGELSALFDDLPDETRSPNAPEAPALPAVPAVPADSELAEKLTAKRKMDTAQVITGVLGAAAFFTLQFGFDLDNAWMVWPVMGLVMVMWYTVFDISDEEEDVLEEIQEKERKERAERLKIAYERRKELGK